MVNEQKLKIKFKYTINSPVYYILPFERRLENSTFTKPLIIFSYSITDNTQQMVWSNDQQQSSLKLQKKNHPYIC